MTVTSRIWIVIVSSPVTTALAPAPGDPPRLAGHCRRPRPIWRYGMALHLLHASPAAAIASYDLRLGAVVVASHNPSWKIGEVVDVNLNQQT